jgi:hypothetical protein
MKKRVLFIILALLLITEVILRLFFSEKFDVAYRPVVYRSLPIVNYGYVPDTCFTLFGKTHYINKQGFIGPDFEKKTPGTFYIAVIGPSSVSGSINLKSYYSFCPMLQKKFNDHNINVQVLNCGVDGGGRSLELFNSIRYQVAGFKPDMILLEYQLPFETWTFTRENYNGYILGYPVHDMDGKNRVKKMVDKLNVYRPVINGLYHSYIIRSLVRCYFKLSGFKTKLSWYIELYKRKLLLLGDFIHTEYTMEKSAQMVHELKKELTENNIRFFLFQYGHNHDVVQVAKENQLPLISLKLSFESDDFFPKDGHWNEKGCQKVAGKLYELVMKYNLLQESLQE